MSPVVVHHLGSRQRRAWMAGGGAFACAVSVLALAALGLMLFAGPLAYAAEGAADDSTSRVAVMSAFEPEWQSLKAAVADPKTVTINGKSFVTGRLDGQDVVLFLSGVSMVNAAMTTQAALDRFHVRAIVFSGIAGGVDPGLSIGDVVIADRWGEYLEAVFARKTDDGWDLPPFADKDFANFGMIFPQNVQVTSARSSEIESRVWFPVDTGLLDLARRATAAVDLRDCAQPTACLSKPPRVIVGGSGVSGMAFVDNADFRKYAFDSFHASVLDMESAAVAHIAYVNDVPFIAVRSLSDLAGGGEGANEMATFFGLAAENSTRVVRALLEAMPRPAPSEPLAPPN